MDNHATTQLDPRVLEAMLPYLTEDFGNPASTDHVYGAKAADAVERSREQLAKTINASAHEIIITSGATEADNLAIQGIARTRSAEGGHIITCTTEHKAVLDPLRYLASQGWVVTYVPVDSYGIIDLDRLESSITDRTILISVMFANNEIGTIAHKAYGPKGVGALYVRSHNPRVKVAPILLGGGQERGLRSGTLNVPSIIGMGEAFEIARREMTQEADRLAGWTRKMRERFENSAGAELNGHPFNRLPHNLNMYFPGVESKALIQSVRSQVAISASSACTTEEVEPSYVILALGYGPERAHSSIRFGLGRFNIEDEVNLVMQSVDTATNRLRSIGVRNEVISANVN